MALVDRLTDTPARLQGKPCSIGDLESRLDGAELDALNAMLYTLGWSQARIYEALTAEGYDVGRQSINRHRARACRCFKVPS
ncbi:MAG TPA: hypothetical protein VJL80_10025 [Aeromicrobium sp.]|nr:hypothetical protein [Aeromicrobium sp.]HKY58364.1 hypothetical protein [Aeromicrobium sp.]